MEEKVLDEPHLTGWSKAVIGSNPKRTLIRLGITVIGIFVILRYVVVPIETKGKSMEPTYVEGKWNLINRLAYLFEEPKRGDVIATQRKGQKVNGKSFLFLKRIVGLPGERVRLRRGKIYIDGEVLEEPYVKPGRNQRRDWFSLTLEEDQYFLIGDNRWVTGNGVFHIRQFVGKIVF